MAKILAISGGVDSMVMLDIFKTDDIIVAHFDHGTRPSSAKDADFVQQKAREYQQPFAVENGQLGANPSEETARTARYQFLRDLYTKNNNAQIYTAHHLDDLVESITINSIRGTGWRGLAVLDAPDIVRPFLDFFPQPWSKKTILEYAAAHDIAFRQDPTNCEDQYLRNRVRKKLADFPEAKKQQLFHLWQQQKSLKREIDTAVAELLPPPHEPWQRSWFQNLDQGVAIELLRVGTQRANISATRPQLENFRQAILNYAPGTYFNLPGDKLIKLNKTTFTL